MDHAVIGGVVAVVVFAMLCLLIVLGRYFARHKGESAVVAAASGMRPRLPFICVNKSRIFSPPPPGTYFTHEAKGADDAADADTAIINAEGGHTNSEEKKEYYI